MLRGRRGPVVVGAIVAVLARAVAVLLVLPKMGEVTSARSDLDGRRGQRSGR